MYKLKYMMHYWAMFGYVRGLFDYLETKSVTVAFINISHTGVTK